MKRARERNVVAQTAWCIALLAVAGCGGGGSSTPVVPVSSSHAPASGNATESLVFTIPKAASITASARRSPAYLASTTQSVVINATPHGSGTSLAGFPQTANLTATSTGCTSTLVSTTCTVTLTLAVGSDDVTITTYDGLGGSGNALSAAQTVDVTVVEGQANTLPIALGGIPTSVKIVAGSGNVGGSAGLVFTLPLGGNGSLLAYGVDADGNIILGAGAPVISASISNTTPYGVTGPTTTAPNQINVTSLLSVATGSIARLTATVTPVAGTGTGAVSKTVTLQAPTLGVIYTANYAFNHISVYDALGDVLSPPGGFPGGSEPYNITYDSQNQTIYALTSAGTAINAYDRNGYLQSLSPGFTVTGTLLGLTYDPQENLLYTIAFPSGAVGEYLPNGSPTSVSPGTFSGSGYGYGFSYDPHNGYLYGAGGSIGAWDSNGNAQTLSGGFPGISQTESEPNPRLYRERHRGVGERQLGRLDERTAVQHRLGSGDGQRVRLDQRRQPHRLRRGRQHAVDGFGRQFVSRHPGRAAAIAERAEAQVLHKKRVRMCASIEA